MCKDYTLSAVLDVKDNEKGAPQNEADLHVWLKGRRLGVLCHGLFSVKDSSTLHTMSKVLLKSVPLLAGIIRFDFHGNGESTGWNTWSYGGYLDEVDDLRCVVETLRNHAAIVSLLLGHSRAATVVLLYGCRYRDIPRIISVAGRVHMGNSNPALFTPPRLALLQKGEPVEFQDALGNTRQITPQCLQRRETVRILEEIRSLRLLTDYPKIAWTHLLIVHCVDDRIVPSCESRDLFDSAAETIPYVSLQLYAQGGHGFNDPGTTLSLSHILRVFFPTNCFYPSTTQVPWEDHVEEK